jgi:hypothetical protein
MKVSNVNTTPSNAALTYFTALSQWQLGQHNQQNKVVKLAGSRSRFKPRTPPSSSRVSVTQTRHVSPATEPRSHRHAPRTSRTTHTVPTPLFISMRAQPWNRIHANCYDDGKSIMEISINKNNSKLGQKSILIIRTNRWFLYILYCDRQVHEVNKAFYNEYINADAKYGYITITWWNAELTRETVLWAVP